MTDTPHRPYDPARPGERGAVLVDRPAHDAPGGATAAPAAGTGAVPANEPGSEAGPAAERVTATGPGNRTGTAAAPGAGTRAETGTGTATGPRAGLGAGLLRTARPRQWVKNLLVVAAPAAAGELAARRTVLQLAVVFVLFTVAASAVYLVNDARDADADRAHPAKCRRPVAAGDVPVPVAYGLGGVLAMASVAGATVLCNVMTAGLLGAYLVIQLAYCLRLKHVLVVDLAVVTTGFLMRAMIGGVALGIPLSRWFLITTGFGALFMVSAKRYSEAVQMAGSEGATRALLTEYSTGYLRFVWQLAAGVAVLGYCLWALESGGTANGSLLPWRQLSVIAFILAVLRYAVFADRGTAGAPEDVVLRDRPLAVIGIVWTAMYAMAVADL
ncbi:decaprenyl-phosphate phosphoribosyltransferase [Streptomyces sp. SP18CS02]|uniref:decaprenyl-phosphate phosphoribosyltransferase n=1 Tax=Streptomyces sp. SP18CS02 TaxID=3002531 RepID=UPI002E7A130A|nr:decaprenyl-phosphate phosphoribosyltransferase [Streptomyces sp. SP18CS02]MEE1756155.1 decaprenyl-phosphate phosphoribosyltransferase [Streptomyces sp. SP18CS02]